jgi:hypothetical protein
VYEIARPPPQNNHYACKKMKGKKVKQVLSGRESTSRREKGKQRKQKSANMHLPINQSKMCI